MRSNAVLCILGALISLSYVNADDDMRAIIMECTSAHGVPKSDLKSFMLGEDNEEMDIKMGCVHECIMQRNGAMEGTNLVLDKIYEHIERSPAPDKDALKKLAAECAAKAEGLTGSCEVGRMFGKCFTKEVMAMIPRRPRH